MPEPRRRRRPAARLVPARAPPTPGTRSGWWPATRGGRSARVMFAVDPTLEVAREAVEWGADLLVVHHPLFLKPRRTASPPTTPKGRTLHTLAAGGCALLTAHTNADQAVGGRLGGDGARARASPTSRRSGPRPRAGSDKVVVFVPVDSTRSAVRTALDRRGRRPDRGLRPGIVLRAGRGPVPPARRRLARRSARSATLEVVDEARVEVVRAARSSHARWSRRCWPRTPTRSRRTTWSSSPTPGWRRPAPAGSARSSRRRSGSSPHGSRRRCRRPPTAYASPATRSGRYGGSRCAAGRATSCSTSSPATDADVYVTSDLRHHRGGRVPRARRAGAGRRRALGGRVDLAAGGGGCELRRRRWAIRWTPG